MHKENVYKSQGPTQGQKLYPIASGLQGTWQLPTDSRPSSTHKCVTSTLSWYTLPRLPHPSPTTPTNLANPPLTVLANPRRTFQQPVHVVHPLI